MQSERQDLFSDVVSDRFMDFGLISVTRLSFFSTIAFSGTVAKEAVAKEADTFINLSVDGSTFPTTSPDDLV